MILTFAVLLLLPVVAYAEETGTIGSLKKTFIKEFNKDISTLKGHRPNYVTIADDGAIKFQVSIKKRITYKYPIHFAYTQRSLWDISEDSSPFKETNYNPEFFYVFGNNSSETETGWTIPRWRLGAEHESNGRAGPTSRSWNTIYIEPTFNYKWGIGAHGDLYEGGELTIAPKVWTPFMVSVDNSDITDYYGYMELLVKYSTERGQLAVIGRKGTKGSHGHIQVDISYNCLKGSDVNSYIQLWHGDGESILGYDKEESRALIGVMFSRW